MDKDFATRTLMALTTALADRAALDAQISTMVAALAKEAGVKLIAAVREPSQFERAIGADRISN